MKELDVESLREAAAKSPKGEAFQLIHQTRGVRVGAGVSGGKPFLEVTVKLLEGGELDLDRLEEQLCLLRALMGLGYRLDGGGVADVSCEFIASYESVNQEVEKLGSLIKRVG